MQLKAIDAFTAIIVSFALLSMFVASFGLYGLIGKKYMLHISIISLTLFLVLPIVVDIKTKNRCVPKMFTKKEVKQNG